MRIRRLSEIDLARISPLERDEKLHRLRELKSGRPPHTYNPLRASLGDILNLQPEMFPGGGSTPWAQISTDIKKKAASDKEAQFNLAVAEALYDFGTANDAKSFRNPISSWNVGYGQVVRYWWNLYTVLHEQPWFLFVDPRLTAPLTKLARRFVFSLMHERIRSADPDFAGAQLVVAQFDKAEKGKRSIRLYHAEDVELFTFDQLNEMIDETYKLWIEVLQERVKSKPTGSTPFGF